LSYQSYSDDEQLMRRQLNLEEVISKKSESRLLEPIFLASLERFQQPLKYSQVRKIIFASHLHDFVVAAISCNVSSWAEYNAVRDNCLTSISN